jgi:hypothetical protein
VVGEPSLVRSFFNRELVMEIWEQVQLLERKVTRRNKELGLLAEYIRKLESRCDRYESSIATVMKNNRRLREELDRIMTGVPPLGVD